METGGRNASLGRGCILGAAGRLQMIEQTSTNQQKCMSATRVISTSDIEIIDEMFYIYTFTLSVFEI
jgi:hypothetical protein